jgi:radical SAM superfamily enzyme YgiQ (UPF0313 family)
MKLLLCAINAKFIHTNLAVYNLAESAKDTGIEIQIAEYTINNRQEELLKEIYREKADIVAFSCYIWNAKMVYELAAELHKVSPELKIWLGGPEVSYDADKVLEEHPEVSLVMRGEGEETFTELCKAYGSESVDLSSILGITYRDKDDIVENENRPPMNMDDIPFVYANLPDFQNKIIYYETSRGCPFACSYCLSSIGERVRFRSWELVKEELQFFLDHKVKQVKFVDRTFNCNRKHAQAIWHYITEHDNGITNFHFEIAADLLNDSDIEMFQKMRPGLIQLEIGVQSTNHETIHEIRRVMNLEKLAGVVAKVKALGNIHQHLDLIAGLPYEGYETFQTSFNEVFAMRPDQLQLGFLKVLKGSYMHEKREDYNILYGDHAPYEVLSTKWISYDEILKLKELEEMVELYYNSDQFSKSLPYAMLFADTPFDFFKELAAFYQAETTVGMKHARLYYYEILRQFVLKNYKEADMAILEELLVYDLYLRENIKKRPDWIPTISLEKKEATNLYRMEESAQYFPEMQPYNSKLAAASSHVERFTIHVDTYEKKEWWALFNYHSRDPLTYGAQVWEVKGI